MSESEDEEAHFDDASSQQDDDDSDDVPLSALKKNHKPTSTNGHGAATTTTSPASNTGRRGVRSAVPVSYAENDDDDDNDDDDSDDDIPLAQLAQKAASPAKTKKSKVTTTQANKTKNGKTNKEKPAKKSAKTKFVTGAKKKVGKLLAATKKKAARVVSAATSGGATTTSSKSYEFASTILYEKSRKGQLVQAILCRWWHGWQWPAADTITRPPPPHFDALDGFPGVYIGTSGDVVGNICDLRDMSMCPSFGNLMRKPAAELQTLLARAIDGQLIQLRAQQSPSDPAVERELRELQNKFGKEKDADKMDREAEKILKSKKLELPPPPTTGVAAASSFRPESLYR